MKRTKLNIFEFTDFRDFLRERLKELKAENAKYSRRYFADRLGLASPSYLKMITDGKRNLSDSLFRRLVDVLCFTSEEAGFFHDLVRYGQARSTEAKADALESLRRNRKFLNVHHLELDQFDYFADPLTLTLRDMVALKDFREDPKWISERLPKKASATRIREALSRLERLGQLERDEDGTLCVTHNHQSTGDRLGSVPLRTYHLKMLDLAKDAMELPVSERHFRGLTMSIPAEAYEEVTKQMVACIDNVRAIVDSHCETEQVYHLEMAFFPLTRRETAEGKA